ncbi:hypothetical protein SNEBB_010465 [Seison nebaliae]|nr:hypothetical protein SNEBB_010465 [Seison nebaliae]
MNPISLPGKFDGVFDYSDVNDNHFQQLFSKQLRYMNQFNDPFCQANTIAYQRSGSKNFLFQKELRRNYQLKRLQRMREKRQQAEEANQINAKIVEVVSHIIKNLCEKKVSDNKVVSPTVPDIQETIQYQRLKKYQSQCNNNTNNVSTTNKHSSVNNNIHKDQRLRVLLSQPEHQPLRFRRKYRPNSENGSTKLNAIETHRITIPTKDHIHMKKPYYGETIGREIQNDSAYSSDDGDMMHIH